MKLPKLLLLLSFLTIHFITDAQQVVVNGYMNEADQRDEWIELLVITDNTDMRGWSLRDNNSSQTSWQPGITFTTNALWNNLRAGTVIMVWSRGVESDGSTAHPSDVNKNDGYIEVSAQNTTYFSGGSFGSSPTWAGNSLNIAGGGDVIELLNSGGTHVHALGHCSTAGSSWTGMATPKLNHANSASSGDAIYVCAGASISDYNGPATGNNFTSKNNSTITFGLPNTCGASANGNTTFWNALREPAFTAQTITPGTSIPGNLSFSWTAATDPNSADGTTGYMILRNTSNTFTAPADGTTYANGATLGSATVLTHITSSATVTYTDNTVTAGNCYFYRIYAYRYTTDNTNGNSYNVSRGRAYNQTNFGFVNCLTVLPIELLSFSATEADRKVLLNWSTATESNNDYFTIERSADAIHFEKLLSVDGAGNSTQLTTYSATDPSPMGGTSYYRLKQNDFNGEYSYSGIEAVTLKNASAIKNIYPNPASDELNIYIEASFAGAAELVIFNTMGERVHSEKLQQSDGENTFTINVSALEKGMYVIRISSSDAVSQAVFIKQ